jgi:hypothetical protein
MVVFGRGWAHPILRSAHEHPRAGLLPVPGRLRLVAPQPEWPCPVDPDV